MELLGNKNKEYNETIIEVTNQLLSSNNIGNVCTDLIAILSNALEKNNIDNKTISLLFILGSNPEVKKIPIINNLYKELKLKYIRIQSINPTKLTGNVPCECTDACNNELPESAKNVAPSVRGDIINGKEKFNSVTGNFMLPATGTTGNLILNGIDYSIGKWVQREVIIDDEGFFVRQISYNIKDEDGVNDIYTDSFLEKLKEDKEKGNEEKSTNTIKEAEETCLTSGESAAETGVKDSNKESKSN